MMHAFGERKTTPRGDREAAGHQARGVRQAVPGLARGARRARPWRASTSGRRGCKQVAELAQARRQHDDVIREGAAIRDLYPDYVEAGSLYELLAEAYLAKGDKAGGGGGTGALRARRRPQSRVAEEAGHAARGGRAGRRKPPRRWTASITSIRWTTSVHRRAGRSVAGAGQRGRRHPRVPRGGGAQAAGSGRGALQPGPRLPRGEPAGAGQGRAAAVAGGRARVTGPRRRLLLELSRNRNWKSRQCQTYQSTTQIGTRRFEGAGSTAFPRGGGGDRRAGAPRDRRPGGGARAGA